MHQAYRRADGIGKVNGATIGDVNSEAKAALICDQAVTTVETLVPCSRPIDNTDARTVYLLRGHERRAAEPVFSPDFPMNTIQSSQRFHLVVRHLDAGDAQSESVNGVGQRSKRLEMFSRKLTCVHLPEVVRVVRVVRLTSTGVLSPA
jgi:hypothetical protein